MSFPNTLLLDDFNRANQTPLAGNWGMPVVSGQSSPNLASNVVVGVGTKSSAYWNSQTFGSGNVEVFLTVDTVPAAGSYVGLWAMIQTPNTAELDGYVLQAVKATGTDTWELVRVDNGAETNILSGTQEYSNGDSFGLKILQSGTIEVWYKPSAGSWGMLNSVSDTTYTSGYIGFEIKGTTGKVDNFSGGVISTMTGPVINPRNKSIFSSLFKGVV